MWSHLQGAKCHHVTRIVPTPENHVTLGKCETLLHLHRPCLKLLKMLSTLYQKVKDVSVVRRLSFAANFLPRGMPNYWETVASFSVAHRQSRNNLTSEQVQVLSENLELIDKEAFATDQDLIKEIVEMPLCGTAVPQGIILISSRENCSICGSKLKIRADRPSTVTVYDDCLGTLLATHFTKYCRKLGCSYQQHYGFSTRGDSSEALYDSDWHSLRYFMSSHETAFAIDMLR